MMELVDHNNDTNTWPCVAIINSQYRSRSSFSILGLATSFWLYNYLYSYNTILVLIHEIRSFLSKKSFISACMHHAILSMIIACWILWTQCNFGGGGVVSGCPIFSLYYILLMPLNIRFPKSTTCRLPKLASPHPPVLYGGTLAF